MTDLNSTSIETPETPRELSHRYRYISLLGEGANGKTWLANDIYNSNKVAIKALKLSQSQNDDFKSLELFKREAATLKSIKLEGVPQFYESIFSDDINNTCYLIQEYVDFPSLQEILNTVGKLGEQDALNILERVSLIIFGLQTVYTPPIIHRDIKPSNILCEKLPDGKVKAYLIDFGAVANPQKRTGGSTIAGTFGYMAPEQLLGDICIQSDYYALGATALQMVTGVPPWKLSSEGFKVDFISVLKEYAPRTTMAYRSLLTALLAPEIENRPNNAKQLVEMIHNVQAGKSALKEKEEDKSTYNYIYERMVKKNKTFDDENWIEVSGRFECIHPITTLKGLPVNGIEYTFEYKGKLYFGIYSNDYISMIRKFKFGDTCIVRFNPGNPRFNALKINPNTHLPYGVENDG